MVEGAFDGAAHLVPDDDTAEIGIAVDAVEGGDGTVKDHGDVQDGDLVGLRVIAAVDEKALVLIAEVVAEDTFHAGAFLFNDQFREVIVVHAGQFYVGMAIPGSGDALSVDPARRGDEQDNI